MTCTPGPAGLIQLDWQQLGSYQQHSAGTTKTVYTLFTTVEHYEYDRADAVVSGNIADFPLVNASGSLGVNHNGEVLLSSNKMPSD